MEVISSICFRRERSRWDPPSVSSFSSCQRVDAVVSCLYRATSVRLLKQIQKSRWTTFSENSPRWMVRCEWRSRHKRSFDTTRNRANILRDLGGCSSPEPPFPDENYFLSSHALCNPTFNWKTTPNTFYVALSIWCECSYWKSDKIVVTRIFIFPSLCTLWVCLDTAVLQLVEYLSYYRSQFLLKMLYVSVKTGFETHQSNNCLSI